MKKNHQKDTQRSQATPSKRLALPRETIRILAHRDLVLVLGGKPPITEVPTTNVQSPC